MINKGRDGESRRKEKKHKSNIIRMKGEKDNKKTENKFHSGEEHKNSNKGNGNSVSNYEASVNYTNRKYTKIILKS